ncbi:hypothetical protein FOZG_18273 [Fusarium oxysporum Fo47]|uniref:HAT C-terminal dimerisation domain-containing protein n=1 Tax=Fusarium oxysporum Fo47 TaxID=660027 RepID=W9JE98_FUSOX|nr:hypothetical protein FOZG_18273 [Fusarium oxysporum Fo47]
MEMMQLLLSFNPRLMACWSGSKKTSNIGEPRARLGSFIILKFIRASPQCTEAFKTHAREQEEVDSYKLAEESTAELEVIQNNATRWNSTYMMIARAFIKQSELNSFIQDLGLEANASKRVPAADILTSDDWKVLREVSHILEPIYNMTMRTQGWGTSGGHGRLWEVMSGGWRPIGLPQSSYNGFGM